jgi:MFS family permease
MSCEVDRHAYKLSPAGDQRREFPTHGREARNNSQVAIRADVRELFTIQDSPGRWSIAVSSAFAMGLPIAVLTLFGQPQLGLIACTGGFTALYLSDRTRRERAILLPFIGAGLLVAGAVGTLVAWSTVLSLAAMFVLAIGASVVLLGFGTGPPGGLFFMLIAGASIRLTAPPSLGGIGLGAGIVMGMLAVGVGIAYLIVVVPLLWPSVRRRDFEAHAARVRLRFDLSGDTLVILIRLTIACAIAVLVAAPFGVHRTYWVLLTVMAILQNGRRLRLTALRAVHRVLGTLVGLVLFALILQWNPKGLWLALVLAVLMFIVQLVVVRNYGLALVFITPLALTIAAQGDPGDVGTVTLTRVVDTLLGAAIALVVLLGALLLGKLRSYRGSSSRDA